MILVDLLERIVVVERRVGRALGGDLGRIVGEAPFRDRGGVDHRDDAVDRELCPESGPVERLDQRLRQREPGGLDDDVIGLRLPREQRRNGGSEILGHGAADAAVGQLDDRLARTGLVGAALQQIAVDADIAELVDDQREAPSAGMAEDMADERGLARAEEAGDDGDGGLGQHRKS